MVPPSGNPATRSPCVHSGTPGNSGLAAAITTGPARRTCIARKPYLSVSSVTCGSDLVRQARALTQYLPSDSEPLLQQETGASRARPCCKKPGPGWRQTSPLITEDSCTPVLYVPSSTARSRISSGASLSCRAVISCFKTSEPSASPVQMQRIG